VKKINIMATDTYDTRSRYDVDGVWSLKTEEEE